MEQTEDAILGVADSLAESSSEQEAATYAEPRLQAPAESSSPDAVVPGRSSQRADSPQLTALSSAEPGTSQDTEQPGSAGGLSGPSEDLKGLPDAAVGEPLRQSASLKANSPKPSTSGRTSRASNTPPVREPARPRLPEERKLTRDTQTVHIKGHATQTVRESAVQMARPGVLIDTIDDKLMIPGAYRTADQVWESKEQAAVTIQCWTRGWLARKRASVLQAAKAERDTFDSTQEAGRQTEAEQHRRREIERRMHPRTLADFELLHSELQAWRLQEARRIKESGVDSEEEERALQQLLHKETKLLQTIDRLRSTARAENEEERVAERLRRMAQPKRWPVSNGKAVEVHTPFTTRAKELMQLYTGLNLPLLSTDERLDVLLHAKWTVKEFDCNLTRDIVQLIDREADLLNRGRHPKTLEGLRKRISTLFLQFVETPEFNPEAKALQIQTIHSTDYLYTANQMAMVA
ncbi:hypothetical protein WJX72_001452 [[Myrmecia] bisecta]|uniref:IQ motif and ubiquitin-like domain-containing protein n=1 Tax=[Myrmecia] bisecta TaxID=41462 RepID=A0AAW1R4V3_9CHLO